MVAITNQLLVIIFNLFDSAFQGKFLMSNSSFWKLLEDRG